jgi:hypothetical protein
MRHCEIRRISLLLSYVFRTLELSLFSCSYYQKETSAPNTVSELCSCVKAEAIGKVGASAKQQHLKYSSTAMSAVAERTPTTTLSPSISLKISIFNNSTSSRNSSENSSNYMKNS